MTFLGKIAIGTTLAVGALFVLGSGDPPPPDPNGVNRYACRVAIEQAATDPKSIEWINRLTWPTETHGDAVLVQAEWRGRNGFGGMTHNVSICTVTKEGENLRARITGGDGAAS